MECEINMNEKEYRDRVLGCWLGKCVGGNIGAPYEGMKQRMSLQFSPDFLKDMLPNDDLDLQIVWLDLLCEKGLETTAADFAAAFVNNCDYAPGEYAFFKKNFRKGICPPLSGTFNNEYFNNGMGAPIRSELWACLFPHDPATAAAWAATDAAVDHRADGCSAHGEMFLSALESLSFGGGDAVTLIQKALAYLPENSSVRAVAQAVLHMHEQGKGVREIVDCAIRDFGHSESAMAPQNLAIVLAAFVTYQNDFLAAVMAAINCGFDTDCTGASLGAVLGILYGGEEVMRICGVRDAEYNPGIRTKRTDHRISTLARDVADLGLRFSAAPSLPPLPAVQQHGDPSIGFGETVAIELTLRAPQPIERAMVHVEIASPVVLKESEFTLDLLPQGKIVLTASVDAHAPEMPEGMEGKVYLNGKELGVFGLSGKRRWQVYGPFWKNIVTVPPLAAGESYWKYIPGSGDEFMDTLRFFHISSLPDDSADVPKILAQQSDLPCVYADTAEDIVRLNDCTGFCGNSGYLFVTRFSVQEDATVGLQIGRNTPIRVWLNGAFLCERSGNEMFYHESIHKLSVSLRRGENTLAFWVVKNSDDTRFSYEFLSGGVCSDHIMFPICNSKIR